MKANAQAGRKGTGQGDQHAKYEKHHGGFGFG